MILQLALDYFLFNIFREKVKVASVRIGSFCSLGHAPHNLLGILHSRGLAQVRQVFGSWTRHVPHDLLHGGGITH